MRRIIKTVCTGCTCLLAGIVFGGYRAGHKYCLQVMENRELVNKHLHMIRTYDVWIMGMQNGASIESYLLDKGIHTVAIYGMSYMGIRLFHELKDSLVHVEYGIDREPKCRIPELKIYKPTEVKNEGIDAVIVTAIFAYDVVKKSLEGQGYKEIIALDDILYSLI